MAWTSVGFDGTITEIQWAGLSSLLGNGYVAAGNGDCLVTAVGGARQVSVAAGSLYGDGVLSTNSGAETVALTTPTNGQWYAVCLRRTWATNTAALVAIAGATTTTTTPTAPPTSFPVLNTNVGVLTDQPIAWAWCNSANTTVVVYDIRLKAVKSMPPVVATSAERDAKFMTPTQGLQVWRNDLGAVETYYTAYDVSTNPGGRDTAGWYVQGRADGLVPVAPTSVVIGSGSGAANALGQITFSAATSLSLNGVFNSAYKSYKIVVDAAWSGSSSDNYLYFRLRNAGTDRADGGYHNVLIFDNGTRAASGGYAQTVALIGRNYYTTGRYTAEFTVTSPATTDIKTIFGNGKGANGAAPGAIWFGGEMGYASSFDGFAIIPSSGTISGTISVYGFND